MCTIKNSYAANYKNSYADLLQLPSNKLYSQKGNYGD